MMTFEEKNELAFQKKIGGSLSAIWVDQFARFMQVIALFRVNQSGSNHSFTNLLDSFPTLNM